MDLVQLEDRLLHPLQDLSHLSGEEQFNLIMSKAGDGESVIDQADLKSRFIWAKQTGQPLKIKLGIDPTGSEIHLGHAIPLLTLNRFQRMGHLIQFVVGDFTAMIGDPGERMDARAPLTQEGVLANMRTYKEQASHILNFDAPNVQIHYNSSWLAKINMTEWLNITKKVTINSLIQREDFRQRLAKGAPLTMAEIGYSLLQGYDSVVLHPDLELGGMDQYLNLHACRRMMEIDGQKPENIFCVNLLPGTTGERDQLNRLAKMSKSKGNYIPMSAPPEDMYGKVMSIPDEVMWIWYRELTEITPVELRELQEAVQQNSIHPKEAKQLLARVIVATFNSFQPEVIHDAEANFNSKFGKTKSLIPDDCIDVQPLADERLLDLLSRASKRSSSDIKRLAEQDGLKILKNDEYVVLSPEQLPMPAQNFVDSHFRLGKRNYYHIIL